MVRFEAKVDWWIGASLAAAVLIPLVAGIATASLWLGGLAIAEALFIFGFGYPQYYDLNADELVIRAGLRRFRIPYPDITVARPSFDSRSSLALSLDRVEIRYGPGGYLLIAPKRQRQFLEELARRAPNLVRRGQDFSVPFSPLS